MADNKCYIVPQDAVIEYGKSYITRCVDSQTRHDVALSIQFIAALVFAVLAYRLVTTEA